MAGVSSKEPVDLGGGRSYDHPCMVKRWLDDMREWPAVRVPDIIFYLLNSKACDLQAVKNYRSLESYNYLQSGWLDIIRATIKKELGIAVMEIRDPKAIIEGGNVLFTGHEFFVGISPRTNEAGARALAAAFPEYPVTPVKLPKRNHLKALLSMAGPDVICLSDSPEAQAVKRDCLRARQ
ncbi:hypothetical protein HPB49_023190 [Dermacentor silvarum]|uniref:Uncharacterized protein n=1 Tax=Dermacentor silvarum TaxID=543639 RepID=A0ACB8E3L8_DERSI|nr:hypothetical protein HPB49_023190 [Dermacentor silvarum]